MAVRCEDLDGNALFKLLQTKYAEKYSRAQKKSWLICIPCQSSLKGIGLNERFVDAHILKPSPFFKSYYTSTDSQHARSYELDGAVIKTPEDGNVNIVSEEVGYSIDYKQFRILLIDQPLVSVKPGRPKVDHVHDCGNFPFGQRAGLLFSDCQKFLQAFPEPLLSLDKKIKQFCSSYIILPDYLDDTAVKLHGIQTWAVQAFSDSVRENPKNGNIPSVELAAYIEFYILSQVHNKLYPVVKKKFMDEDKELTNKLQSLHQSNFTPDQLGVKEEFCCQTPSAVVELASLNQKTSPVEKLFCFLSTLELLNEDIEKSLRESYSAVSPGNDVPHLSSDDLIPLLVHVMVQARPLYLASNLFYVQNFCWYFSAKDRLSFSLVTFQAAKEFLKNDIGNYLKPSTRKVKKEMTLEELMNVTVEIQEKDKDKNRNVKSEPSESSVDRQLHSITRMIEASTKELRESWSSQKLYRTSYM